MKTIKFSKINLVHPFWILSFMQIYIGLILILSMGLMGFSSLESSSRMLKGKVLDGVSHIPLSGVKIQWVKRPSPVFSDSSGNFILNLPDSLKEGFLILAKPGYKPRYLKMDFKMPMVVYLDPIKKEPRRLDSTNLSSNTLNKERSLGTGGERYKNGGVQPKILKDLNCSQENQNIADNTGVIGPNKVHGVSEGIPLPHGTGYNPGFYRRVFQEPTNESYQEIKENSFVVPISNPLSTFSVHVDGTAYSNIRRFLNQGQIPPKNAIRLEEMLNYFHYNTSGPDNQDPVAIHTEISQAPWNPQHPLVRISLKSKTIKTQSLPPARLVFLLDVSGSMAEPNKLPLVKASMCLLVDQLRPVDEIAIVVYAGETGLKLPMTSGDQKTKIKEVINSLNAGGSTAGADGLIMAYDIARKTETHNRNTRIILATDGDFNVGSSSDKDMEQLIEEEDKSGVKISILGFGMGNLKDSKMERMAYRGHGNYAYIDNILEASKSMVNEFGGTFFTLAKDVKMQIEFNPAKVQAYRLLGYENHILNKEDFNNDGKIGGDMGPGQEVMALYEIIPVGQVNSFNSVDSLKYQNNPIRKPVIGSSEWMTVKFRYKDPESETSKLVKVEVREPIIPLNQSSEDFRFSSSVAELGLILRNSEFKQGSSFSGLIHLAKGAKGKDEEGYRAEFIRLAETAQLLLGEETTKTN